MGVRVPAAWMAAAGFGLLVLMGAAAFFGPAAPLQTKMTQHFLEAAGRSPEQLAARAVEERRAEEARLAAERQAAEVRQRQQAQEETRARQARELNELTAEYRQIIFRHSGEVIQFTDRAARIVLNISERAKRPDFYRSLTPEDVASRRACDNPDTPRGNLGPGDDRRRVNGWVCTVHLSLNYPSNTHSTNFANREAITHLALVERTFYEPPRLQENPLPVIITHVWTSYLAETIRRREVPAPLPSLMLNNEINPQLLGGVLAPGFTQLLIASATASEKVQLATQTYADLRRLTELATRIVPLCSALQRPVCLRAED